MGGWFCIVAMGIQLVHGLLSVTRCPLLGMSVFRGSTVDLSHYILCVICHNPLLPSFCYFLLYSSGGQDALTDLKGVIIVYIIIYNFFLPLTLQYSSVCLSTRTH